MRRSTLHLSRQTALLATHTHAACPRYLPGASPADTAPPGAAAWDWEAATFSCVSISLSLQLPLPASAFRGY